MAPEGRSLRKAGMGFRASKDEVGGEEEEMTGGGVNLQSPLALRR